MCQLQTNGGVDILKKTKTLLQSNYTTNKPRKTMTDQFVKEQLCKRLNSYCEPQQAQNTIYRKVINLSGESRWTLAFSIFEALQNAADYVNSTVDDENIVLDSLPARFQLAKKYSELQKQRAPTTKKTKKSPKKDSGAASASSLTANAAIVARNVEHVLSMQCLLEALNNVKVAIARFCDKKRYRTDDLFVAVLFSLLNSATRIVSAIQKYLQDLKVLA